MSRIFSMVVIALAFALPASSLAATLGLSPTTISVTPGKVFTVTLTAVPEGAKLYTVRSNVSFDSALVTVTNFAFAPKWLALSTTGYDSIDNTNGLLVKTAGYPGGITAPTVFGTITFQAKVAGTAHIDVTGQSMLLDENSKNTISGTQGITQVVISAPSPVKPIKTVVVVKKPVVKVAVLAPKVATTSAPVVVATGTEPVAPIAVATTSALAAAGATGFSFGSPLGILLILLMIALVAGGTWYYRRRMN